ncbi:atp-binding cassette sub-family b [Holotrichia oblita]|nr:atp-binding cassette sub-family b [Holotrichia oblita]
MVDARYWKALSEAMAADLRTQMISVRMSAIGNALGMIPMVVMLIVGALRVADSTLTTGQLLSLTLIGNGLIGWLAQVPDVFSYIQRSQGAGKRIYDYLDLPEEHDGLYLLPNSSSSVVELRDVHFAYAGEPPLLKGISLTVNKGETVALVGISGCGKSTLLKLICGFLHPETGTVMVQGGAVNEWALGPLRSQLALVAQDSYLFPGSIRDNLLAANNRASDQQLLQACERAGILAFVNERGLDAQVGERGMQVSGGERQRLSIARAMLKDAPLLLLDEPTSALDAAAENIVQQSLERLMEGRTTLVVAHRLSTIRKADRIVVIDDGHSRKRWELTQAQRGTTVSHMSDLLAGAQLVRIYGEDTGLMERFIISCKQLFEKAMSALNITSTYYGLNQVNAGLTAACSIGLGLVFYSRGIVDIAALPVLIQVSSMVVKPISNIGDLLFNLQESLSGARRVVEILDLAEEEIDTVSNTAAIERTTIVADKLSFSYDDGKAMLKEVSFMVQGGQIHGIVGYSGSGKSTLLRLLMGIDKYEGKLTIGGQEVRDMKLSQLRQISAYVPQECPLFDGTIMENIRVGNQNATDQQVIDAAIAADVDTFVKELEQGYQTVVGESGAKLSGGQRQRIAIARAVLKDAPLLLLDEDIEAGQDYKELPSVMAINIINFEFIPVNDFHTTFHLWEDNYKHMLAEALEIHFIEIPKFKQLLRTDIKNKPLHRWLAFFDKETPVDILEEVLSMDTAIKKVNEKIEFISNNKDTLRLYQMWEMALSDYTSGINAAEERKAVEIAKNAIKKSFNIADIADITGLEEFTIKKLQAELNNE